MRGAVAGLLGVDLSVADHDALAAAGRHVARLQAFVDHAKVQIGRRGRQLAEAGDASSHHVLIDEARLTGKDAATTGGRDRVCTELPEFESALADGAVTGSHLDALAHLTKGLSEIERSELAGCATALVTDATRQPAGQFERNAKALVERIRDLHRPGSDADELDRQRAASRVKRWTDRETGMKQTLVSLDPLRDAAMWNVIDAQLARLRNEPGNDRRPFHELQIEALVSSVGAAPAEGREPWSVPEVVVHVDHRSLCHGRHADTLCETVDGQPMPVATTQRLCCEAVVQAVIVRPDGTVDRLCAERRTASRQQRRLLAAVYATCAHPRCDIGFAHCRIHHVEWFTRGGETVTANLLPLCESHHHLVHEGGWSLTIDTRRTVTWLRPDGTVWTTDGGPNRQPHERLERAASDRCERPPGSAHATKPPPPPTAREPGPRAVPTALF